VGRTDIIAGPGCGNRLAWFAPAVECGSILTNPRLGSQVVVDGSGERMRPPGKHRRRRTTIGVVTALAVLTAAAVVVALSSGQTMAFADIWWSLSAY
jgi:hypothetical protein